MDAKIVDRLGRVESARVDVWARSLSEKQTLLDATRGLPGGVIEALHPALVTDLAPNLRPDWLVTCGVLTLEGDPSRLLVRDVGTRKAPAVEVYTVGACRWCESPAPLGEPRDLDPLDLRSLGVTLTFREPAEGHVCPGVAGLLRR